MRRYVVVLAVLGCLVAGCASASDVRAGVRGSDGPGADDGGKGAGERAGRDHHKKSDGKGKDKGHHKRHKGRDKLPHLEVRLPHVVGKIDRFSSPSANIGCQITGNAVRCDIEKRRYQPPHKPRGCDLDYGNSFAVGRGEPDLGCVGDTVLGAPITLSYGTSTRVGDYGCQSRKDGMRCYNLRTGRGFLVSRELYEFY